MSQPASIIESSGAPKLVLLKDFLPPFKIGDKVRLKSGGPVLTVTTCHEGQVECQWFEGVVAKQKIFPVGALNLCLTRMTGR